MPTGNPKDEYKDLSNNMRHYGNMRFAQITLFVALTAGLLSAVFTQNLQLQNSQSLSDIRFSLKFLGLITAVVFWIMEERSADYWNHFRSRAVKLEEQLGYRQYWKRPEFYIISQIKRKIKNVRKLYNFMSLVISKITTTNATRLFYFTMIIFWMVTLYCNW